METAFIALRIAVRSLGRRPGEAAYAALTLGLGIGLAVLMFSIVYGVLLRPLPLPGADRLMAVGQRESWVGAEASGLPVGEFLALRGGQRSFDRLAGFVSLFSMLSGGRGPTEAYLGARVTPGFFKVLGVRPALGRGFSPADGRAGAPRVMLISDRVFRRRFAGDPAVLGSPVILNREAATVVGVMPPGFAFPLRHDLWVPLREDAVLADSRFPVYAVGRLAAGISPQKASAELTGLFAAAGGTGSGRAARLVVEPYSRAFLGSELKRALQGLLAAVAGVLLIAALDVAHLLLARGLDRAPEMAVRASLGAGPVRLALVPFAEALLLATVGGVCGLLAAWGGTRLFDRTLSSQVLSGYWMEVRLDPGVAAFAVAASALACLVAGTLPALPCARADAGRVLRSGGDRLAGRGGRGGRGLVVAQMALTTALLLAAGGVVQGLFRLARLDPGFQPAHAATARVSLFQMGEVTGAARLRFFSQLVRRLAARPDVAEVSLSSAIPVWRGEKRRFRIAMAGAGAEVRPAADLFAVSPGFFRAWGLRVHAGRTLAAADDRPGGAPVAVVDRTLAERWFSGAAVGRTLWLEGSDGEQRPFTVVGVVGDLLALGPAAGSPGRLFVPLAGEPLRDPLWVTLRAASDAAAASALRGEVASLDPRAACYDLRPLADLMAERTWRYRVLGGVVVVFAAAALLLAGLGLFAVMASAVARWRREVGVRMALGARRKEVRRYVLRRGLGQALLGLIVGTALAVVPARWLRAVLFGVEPWTAAGFLAAVCVVAGTALLATWVPASRAASTDPAACLRPEGPRHRGGPGRVGRGGRCLW